MPVLRRNFAEEAARAVWKETFGGRAAGVGCPSCARDMTSASVAFDGGAVELDVCRPCALVWFDPDEHRRLPPAPYVPPPDDGLPPEVRQRLAILEVQEMERRWREEDALSPSLRPGRLPALLGVPVEVIGHELAGVPWATWTIAAAIAGVSIAGFAWPSVVERLQLVPDQIAESAGVPLLTCFFVHAGWWHLLSNLWFLVVFGDNVEDLVGHRRWLLLLFAGTFLGSVAHVVLDPQRTRPCVGASGGISGLIVFYALALPNARLGVFVGRGLYLRWITFSAKTFLMLWLVIQVFVVVRQVSESGNVSGLAHIGGAMAGFLFWLLWRKRPSS